MSLTIIPKALNSYAMAPSVGEALWLRIVAEPFNLLATVLFFMAVIHTFLTSKFTKKAHAYEQLHHLSGAPGPSFKAVLFEFLGEIEVVFGLWVLPLMVALICFYGWSSTVHYFNTAVNYSEALFVGVIMLMASTQPILHMAESILQRFAKLGGLKPSAWWVAILVIGPILGSLITEPAAMTICALLLAKQFYAYPMPMSLKYGTLGLLFVNISVGGTLTHFAAPPIVMVVGPWDLSLMDVFMSLGWKSILGILVATASYYIWFKKDLQAIDELSLSADEPKPQSAMPLWVYAVHSGFLCWSVLNLHHPILCLGGLLFFLGFMKASGRYQSTLNLRAPLLVSFFLAGLVTHGTLQGWWLEVILTRLNEWGLFFSSIILTAFNDNAAITFLCSLVPKFAQDPVLQHAVMAGAVTGGGLTVIANAPNPAGQSILSRFFPDGVSAGKLFLSALWPTLVMGCSLMLMEMIR